ncbi:TPA: hypothetical protein ACH3X2_007103 [Trebouxia sp. C0005]
MEGVEWLLATGARHAAAAAALLLVDACQLLALRRTAAVTWQEQQQKNQACRGAAANSGCDSSVRACIGKVHNAVNAMAWLAAASCSYASCQLFVCHLQLLT